MRATVAPADPDHVIARLARTQYGVVSRAQLLAAGIDRGRIARRVAAGRLHRLHEGIYAVGHTAPRREMRWLAAVLACGDGAVLSHRSAATLWSIRDGEGPHPDVGVATRNGRRRPGVVLHRTVLEPHDRTRHRGIPVTTTARTLVDLAHEVERAELVRALREAQFLRRFDPVATRAALARRPSAHLRALIEDLALTRSHIEDRLLEICDRWGIERAATQQSVVGRRVDFLWPGAS